MTRREFCRDCPAEGNLALKSLAMTKADQATPSIRESMIRACPTSLRQEWRASVARRHSCRSTDWTRLIAAPPWAVALALGLLGRTARYPRRPPWRRDP